MTLAAMLADLPTACSTGIKRNAKGHNVSWIGYKLHIDTADGDIPISCLLTSASVHDSQAAIPLASISAGRVTNLYDLMDSAYDAPEIWDKSRALGHAPIIDAKPRRGCKAQAAAEDWPDGAPVTNPPKPSVTTSEPQRSASTARSRTAMADGLCGCEVTPRSSAISCLASSH